MGVEINGWVNAKVIDLQKAGLLLVEDGNHGEYRPRKEEFGDEGVSFIRAADMKNSQVLFNTAQRINTEAQNRIRKGIGAGGDVILSHKGTVGKVAYVPLDAPPFVCSPQTTFWRTLDNEKIDRRYLSAYLNSYAFQSQLYSRQNETDMAGYVSLTAQRAFDIILPPISEQKAIAHVLGALDDRIDLNRRMNETLEAMAQALFKSWFVDFDPVIDNALAGGKEIPEELSEKAQARAALGDERQPLPEEIRALFPDEFTESDELGWIPKGWMVKMLEEATSLIIDHRGKTPKKLGGEWAESGYPAISAKNIKNGKLVRVDTIRYVDEELYIKWMKEPLQPGDIALTSEAPLGELYYFASKHNYLLSQRLYGLRAEENSCSGAYLFYWLQTGVAKADLAGRATGTTVVGIRQSELRKVNILCAHKKVIDSFTSISGKYLSKIDQNESQSNGLTKLRDTLLPKLLSGEIRIPDAEKMVEELAL